MAEYNSDSLDVLSGLDPVKKRPGMYTDTSRPNHLVQEVVDNSVDEALAGHATTIEVSVDEEGRVTVTDDGRGMPVDIHKKEKISGVELVLTKLHAGGKFSSDNYKVSGGLHGVGISVVNALSLSLDVTVWRNSKEYEISFANGFKSKDLVERRGVKNKTGTRVSFLPDPKYFENPKVSSLHLSELLKTKAVLCPGLRVIYSPAKGDVQEWFYQNGLKEHFAEAVNELQPFPDDPIYLNVKSESGEVECALSFTDDGTIGNSYVNLIPTVQGGTHVAMVRNALANSVRNFCETHGLLPKNVSLTAEDICHSLSYIISLKIPEPQFSGQVKEKLTSSSFGSDIGGQLKDYIDQFFGLNIEVGQAVAQRAIDAALRRNNKSKQVKRKKISQGPTLPGKLSDCSSSNLEETELFLVEGDSAGGSAKQARDRVRQAILPLRGKILNTWEVDAIKAASSIEINDLSIAIGVNPGDEDLSKLRYGKICILADADSDGLHIATLLCALFYRHYRPLVEQGRIYIAMPPLYRIDIGKEVFYAVDEKEKNSLLKKLSKKKGSLMISRFKGLGEMNPGQLRETVMNPDERKLVKLTIGNAESASAMFDLLLSKKMASGRNSWIQSKGNIEDIK